jgi:hypothetical protein
MARRRAAELVRAVGLALARAGVFFFLVAVRIDGVWEAGVAIAGRAVGRAPRRPAAREGVAGSAAPAAMNVATTAANALDSARRIRRRSGMSPYGRTELRPLVTEVSAL